MGVAYLVPTSSPPEREEREGRQVVDGVFERLWTLIDILTYTLYTRPPPLPPPLFLRLRLRFTRLSFLPLHCWCSS